MKSWVYAIEQHAGRPSFNSLDLHRSEERPLTKLGRTCSLQ